MKVNITPPARSNKVGNDLDIAPIPGLQNNKDLQCSEDTKLKSKESGDLYYTFHKQLGIGYQGYEVPLSRMLHDILDDDHIQWHPTLIGHYTNFWPLLIWTLLPNLTFYLIVQGFHRTYATGAACQQRTLTPDTWFCPTLGLACVLMSRPISPELVLSPDFWISNIPRYFSFAIKVYQTNQQTCTKQYATSSSKEGIKNSRCS